MEFTFLDMQKVLDLICLLAVFGVWGTSPPSRYSVVWDYAKGLLNSMATTVCLALRRENKRDPQITLYQL